MQRLADLLEGKWPAALAAQYPRFGVIKQSPASAAPGADVFLKTLDRIGQNRKHQFQLWQQVISSLKGRRIFKRCQDIRFQVSAY